MASFNTERYESHMQATEMAEMLVPFLNKRGWDQKNITGFVQALNSSASSKNQEVKFASTEDTSTVSATLGLGKPVSESVKKYNKSNDEATNVRISG